MGVVRANVCTPGTPGQACFQAQDLASVSPYTFPKRSVFLALSTESPKAQELGGLSSGLEDRVLLAVCMPPISLPVGCGGGLQDLSSLLEVRLFGAGLCSSILSSMPLGCCWQSIFLEFLFRN